MFVDIFHIYSETIYEIELLPFIHAYQLYLWVDLYLRYFDKYLREKMPGK